MRCEYFATFFAFVDMSEERDDEENSTLELNFPFEGDVARAVVHYLYTDQLVDGVVSPKVGSIVRPTLMTGKSSTRTSSETPASDDIPQFLCHLLVAADQLILPRLVQVRQNGLL